MSESLVDRIAHAVLYEGYVLYPYRPSVKNHQRWTFGGIYPRAFVEANPGADACSMQAQCLLKSDPAAEPTVSIKIRFLHLMTRTIQRAAEGMEPRQQWQEAVERELPLAGIAVVPLLGHPRLTDFSFPRQRIVEERPSESNTEPTVREQESIEGSLEISAERAGADVYRLSLRIENRTAFEANGTRDAALVRSFISTHAALTCAGGGFVSLTDPPDALRDAAAACRNIGCWPVLVGAPGETNTMLASPIILYDYPKIAPESPGDLFDSTEIDEILTLRIMTLTDEERRQAMQTDDRVRAMFVRTQTLAREQLMGLHGTFRGMTPTENPQQPPAATPGLAEQYHA